MRSRLSSTGKAKLIETASMSWCNFSQTRRPHSRLKLDDLSYLSSENGFVQRANQSWFRNSVEFSFNRDLFFSSITWTHREMAHSSKECSSWWLKSDEIIQTSQKCFFILLEVQRRGRQHIWCFCCFVGAVSLKLGQRVSYHEKGEAWEEGRILSSSRPELLES